MSTASVPPLVIALSGATAFAVYVLLLRMALGARVNVLRRYQQFVERPARQIEAEAEALRQATEGEDPEAPARVRREGRLARYFNRVQRQLTDAGVPLRAQEYVALELLSAVVLTLIVLLFTRIPLFLIAGFIGGSSVPPIYVAYARQRRNRLLSQQIPDMLVMLSNGLKAGYGLLQAADAVAAEMDPPMKDEFRKLTRETHLGVSVDQALRNLGQRVQNPDMDLVVQAILIQRQVGGNLAEVLDNIHEAIRERIRIKGEIRTLTTQGRVSAWIIATLPIALALMIGAINPEFMGILFTDPLGWAMLGVAALMEIIGIVFIRRIVMIEV